MSKALVSVNLTTYNRAHFLSRVLDSVLAQTYQNLEIVIVDDCSADNTSEVVRSYQLKNQRIKYIRHDENKKLAKSRNTAWKMSKGKYIATLDDDDWWIDQDKLSKQVDILNKSPSYAIVCSNVRYFKSSFEYEDRIVKIPRNLRTHILSRNGIIYTSTSLIRRNVLEEIGGFDENIPKGVDSELYRNCIVKNRYKVYFMPDVTTAYSGYGDDRITPVVDNASIWKAIYTHSYLLKKYFYNYITHPVAFMKRLSSIIKLLIRFIIIYQKQLKKFCK